MLLAATASWVSFCHWIACQTLPRVWLLVAIRRREQGPDCSWLSYPSLTFQGASLKQSPHHLCERCFAFGVHQRFSWGNSGHPVDALLLTFPTRQVALLYSVAESWMVAFDPALSPVSCGLAFVPCVPSKKMTKLIKEVLRELLKEVKIKIFPIIIHIP